MALDAVLGCCPRTHNKLGIGKLCNTQVQLPMPQQADPAQPQTQTQ